MADVLPKDKDIVSISQAAEILGVSIDTIRRWDKAGILHSQRPDGKTRYFSVNELEKVKLSAPMPISEVSRRLNISPSTLRRLEKKGMLNPERNESGERVYKQEELEKFLDSEYFLRQKEVEEKILEPLKEPQEIENETPRQETTHKILSVAQEEVRKEVSKLNVFRKTFYAVGLFLVTLIILSIVLITVLFLLYPETTAKFFGYRSLKPPQNLAQNYNPKVLGAQYSSSKNTQGPSVLGAALKPISQVSLGVVKIISPRIYNQVVQKRPIQDVNDVLSFDDKGNLTPSYTFRPSDSSFFQIPDTGLIQNLNADYIRGKVPGDGVGDIVIFDKNNTVPSLAITGANLGVGIITNTNISDNAAILDSKLSQITASSKVAGSAVQLSSGGGLTNNSGLSLSTSCSGNQVLAWDGSKWKCADQISTVANFTGSLAGDVTGSQLANTVVKIKGVSLGSTTATAGNLLIGDGSSWVSTALSGDATLNASGTLSLGSSIITTSNISSNAVTSAAGTANQVLVNGGTSVQQGAITLSLPQSIATASTPQFAGLTLTGGLTLSGVTTDITTGANEDLSLVPNGSGKVNINTTSGLASLDVRANSVGGGTIPVASISGRTSFAALVIDNITGDLLTASSSGVPQFVIKNNGLTAGSSFGILNTDRTITQGVATATNACVNVTNGLVTGTGSCSAPSDNWWTLSQSTGVLYPGNLTTDFLTGGTSSSSATFHLFGTPQAGTRPVASISGRTSFAALVIDNITGDLLTASSSGVPQFVIKNNGLTAGSSFGILNTDRTITQGVATATNACVNVTNGLVTGTGTCPVGPSSNNWWTLDSTNGVLYPGNLTTDFLTGGTSSSSATFHLFGTPQAGTRPVASISAKSSFAALVVDNSGKGDLFTASSSGLSRFVITQGGNVGIGTTTPGSVLTVSGSLNQSGGDASINLTGSSNTSIGNSTGTLTLASGGTSSWTNTDGNLTISTSSTGTLALTSAGALNFSAQALSTFTLPAIVDAFNIDANTISVDALNHYVGIGTNAPVTTLDVLGTSLDSQNDGAIAAVNIGFSVIKSDAIPKTFLGVTIKPTLDAGLGDSNTTLNVLNIDTTNNNTTGISTNLINASYGGTSVFKVDSSGIITLAGGGLIPVITTSAGTAPIGLTFQPGNNTTNSGTGASLTLKGGNETGLTSVGGNLVLEPGTGTSSNGAINIGSTNVGAITIGTTTVGAAVQILDDNWSIGTTGIATFASETLNGSLTFSGVTTDITTGTNEDLSLVPNGSGKILFNTTTVPPQGGSFNIRPNSVAGGTISIASISGRTSFAVLVVDNITGDLFTASSSGVPQFVIKNNGLTAGSSFGILNIDRTITQGVATATNACVNVTNGLVTGTGSCPATGNNWWTLDSTNGVLYPGNLTTDFLTGGTSSSSATFHLFGTTKAGTNPVASISAKSSFAALVVDNSGKGDIFAASSSGRTRFVVTQTGDVVLGADGTTPTAVTIRGAAGAGTNVAGANLTFDASNGTGNGGSGALIFRTALNSNEIIVDHTSSANTNPDANTLSWSHTVGSGANQILVVGVSIRGNTAISSIMFNSVNLTQVREDNPGSDVRSEIWYLQNPTQGTYTITISADGVATIEGGGVSFNNVGSVGSNNGSTGTDMTDSWTDVTTAAREVVVDAIALQSPNPTLTPLNQTQTSQLIVAGTAGTLGMSIKAGANFDAAMQWTFSLDTYASSAFTLQSADPNNNLANTLSERMRIDSQGRVGIGTTTPGTKVDINGTLRTNNNLYVAGGTANFASGGDVLNINKQLGANATDSWSTGTSGGTTRYGHTSILYNGKIYSWGGIHSGGLPLNTVDIYDIASDSWSTGTSGGTARVYHTSILYNGKIYSWGGLNISNIALDTVDIYDIASNSWSTGTSGGTARYGHTSILYNGKIYSWGGLDSGGIALDTVDIYDIASNSWSTGANGGTARYAHASILYNGKIYSWGGRDSDFNLLDTVVEIYDIASNSWSTGAPGGTARSHYTSILYNGKIYSWGGYDSIFFQINTVDIYDIASNSWSTGTAGGTMRAIHTSILYNGKIYSWGGYDGAALDTVDIYDIGYRQTLLALQENGIDTLAFQSTGVGTDLFLSQGRLGIMGGNVGIGTSQPAAVLHLVGDLTGTNTNAEVMRFTRSSSSGAGAAGLGGYISGYLEDASSNIVEAGRMGFSTLTATTGDAYSSEYIVRTERETYADMIDVLTAYADGNNKWICGNSNKNGDGYDCFGFTIGSGNDISLEFDGATRVLWNYGTTPNTFETKADGASDMKFTTLGAHPIYFDASNNGTDLYIASNGNINIGSQSATTVPFRLYVSDYKPASASAMIENTGDNGGLGNCANSPVTTACHIGLIVKMGLPGTAGVALNDNDRFIQFMRGDGLTVGKIQGTAATTIAYTGNGTDMAEYFKKENSQESFGAGELVCTGNTNGVRKCDGTYSNIVGVISTAPSFIGGVNHEHDNGYVLVGIVGQLRVKVVEATGASEIKTGDFVAASASPGVGQKASKPGIVAGKALESQQPDGTVLVAVLTSFFDPIQVLTTSGDLSISQVTVGSYALSTPDGSPITTTGAFSTAKIANLEVGKISASEIVTDKLTVSGLSLTDYINKTIASLSGNLEVSASSSASWALGSLSSLYASSSAVEKLASQSAGMSEILKHIRSSVQAVQDDIGLVQNNKGLVDNNIASISSRLDLLESVIASGSANTSFASLKDLSLDGLVIDNTNRFMVALGRNDPTSTVSAGIVITSVSGNLTANIGNGAHAFELADSRFTIVLGEGTTNNFYDPSSGIFSVDKVLLNSIQPATGESINMLLSKDGTFAIQNASDSASVVFDSHGNGFFSGTITANKIKANQIEGLDLLISNIKFQSAQDFASSKPATSSAEESILGASSSALLAPESYDNHMLSLASLSVDGLARLDSLEARQATVSADLRVKGNGLIEGILSVIDTITTKNIIVTSLSHFFGDVMFSGNVTFENTPTFNNDTAGTVVIKKGTDTASVIFEKEYANTPIITISISVNQLTGLSGETVDELAKRQSDLEQAILTGDIRSIITLRTSKGFTIKLNKLAPENIEFSWSALTTKQSVSPELENVTASESATIQ